MFTWTWAAACRQDRKWAKVGLGNAQTFTFMLSITITEECVANIILKYCKHKRHRYEGI